MRIPWNYTTQLFMGLFILCILATLLQFFTSRCTIFISDLGLCTTTTTTTTTTNTNTTKRNPSEKPWPLPNRIIKRAFNTYGEAPFNFISMGAYRSDLNKFAIVGLALKSLHEYGQPTYLCKWVNHNNNNIAHATTKLILPDQGYGRVYTAVVIICKFKTPINSDNSGGKLLLHLSANTTNTIEALVEAPNSVNFTIFTNSKPKYDHLYCGSPLYGNLSPQRVREWIAYHVKLFGERSHFVIHDAGGVHEEVMEVLKPWMELGYVTLQDIKDQERFDGYYHNQFMVVNDCLHRYKLMAKWMFFFDVDEFISVPQNTTLESVLASVANYSQLIIKQMTMSRKICLSPIADENQRKWEIEKMVYKDVKRGKKRDVKYTIQPRKASATGVHMSKNIVGKTKHSSEIIMKYYHFHGTIAERHRTCTKYVNFTQISQIKEKDTHTPFVLDTTLRDIAWRVKQFEYKMIGPRLNNTIL